MTRLLIIGVAGAAFLVVGCGGFAAGEPTKPAAEPG